MEKTDENVLFQKEKSDESDLSKKDKVDLFPRKEVNMLIWKFFD